MNILSWSIVTWFEVFQWTTAIAALLTFGAVVGTVITGNIANRQQAEKLFMLDKANADAQRALESERIKRLELERSISRRELLDDIDLSALKAFGNLPAVMQFLPNDQETERAAGNLYAILQSSGWNMQRYSPNPELSLPEWDGVVVESFIPAKTDFRKYTDEEKADIARLKKAADVLVAFLREHHWEARIGSRSLTPLPLNALSIKVGFKSLPRVGPAPAP